MTNKIFYYFFDPSPHFLLPPFILPVSLTAVADPIPKIVCMYIHAANVYVCGCCQSVVLLPRTGCQSGLPDHLSLFYALEITKIRRI
jgi:hypothetical protein